MFNKLKLSAKITALATILLVIMAILGIMSAVNMLSANTKVDAIANQFTTASDIATKIAIEVGNMRMYAYVFSYSDDENAFKKSMEYCDTLEEIYKNTETFLAKAKNITKFKSDLPKLRDATIGYKSVLTSEKLLSDEMLSLRTEAIDKGVKLSHLTTKIRDGLPMGTQSYIKASQLSDVVEETRQMMYASWISSDTNGYGTVVAEASEDQSVMKELQKMNISEEVAKLLKESIKMSEDYVATSIKIANSQAKRSYEIAEERVKYGNIITTLAGEIAAEQNQRSTEEAQDIFGSLTISSIIMIIGLFAAIILGIIMSIIIIRSIVTPIHHAITGLSSGSDQVTAASQEISSASQGLASGASEQAASLEEISSSLNEITSMTKQTADNVRNADLLVKEVGIKMQHANQSMEELKNAANEIQTSNIDTAKILKDIDEITKQINLLSLNAAIEAARAGEAGKGFAVVADAVRNLAKRSAQSSKKTAELINESKLKSQTGVDLAEKTSKELMEVSENAQKVSMIISEITNASDEQARGISQVNSSIGNMDQVTQANASSSEELAASSEELSAQSLSMNDLVQELAQVIDGEDKKTNGGRKLNENKKHSQKTITPKEITMVSFKDDYN
jgi:methyl-accepting chemotaxis protein